MNIRLVDQADSEREREREKSNAQKRPKDWMTDTEIDRIQARYEITSGNETNKKWAKKKEKRAQNCWAQMAYDTQYNHLF